jgi:hypothetical protein
MKDTKLNIDKPKETLIISGTISAVSPSSKYNSFMVDQIWYNVPKEKAKSEEIVSKGDTVEFSYTINGANRILEELLDIQKIQVKEESSWSDEFISFDELLDSAHKKFDNMITNMNIYTEIKSVDMEKKFAIVKAIIEVTDKESLKIIKRYEAHGDATQDNCQSGMIKPHFIRMAETRALARVCRFATNNAMTSREEVSH